MGGRFFVKLAVRLSGGRRTGLLAFLCTAAQQGTFLKHYQILQVLFCSVSLFNVSTLMLQLVFKTRFFVCNAYFAFTFVGTCPILDDVFA